jgi:hypothetical protein
MLTLAQVSSSASPPSVSLFVTNSSNLHALVHHFHCTSDSFPKYNKYSIIASFQRSSHMRRSNSEHVFIPGSNGIDTTRAIFFQSLPHLNNKFFADLNDITRLYKELTKFLNFLDVYNFHTAVSFWETFVYIFTIF